jgi:hypothetical protein
MTEHLSVTIHTGESGKRYWFSLFLLIKSKNYILLTELAKTFFFCPTLGQTGTGVLSDPGARVAQWVRSLDLTAHTSLSPIRHGFVPGFVNYKKGCTRLAAASDKAYQLLAHGQWFSPGTPTSSTTKTGRHDIAENGVKHQKSNHLSDPWPLCLSHHFFVILYITCHILFFIQNWMQDYL